MNSINYYQALSYIGLLT